MRKSYLFFIQTFFVLGALLSQSTSLKAQFYVSVGRSGEREMYMQGYDAFKSKNTICVDVGASYIELAGDPYSFVGYGFTGGLGIKSFELSTLSEAMQGATRKMNWELSVGPAAWVGSPVADIGLLLSAQPCYTIAKLLSAEDDVIVGSLGIKLTAEIKIKFFSFGVCYNPADVKLYKNNTNTNYFGAYNGKIIYARPALEFRVGVIIWSGE
ncbi:MAG: hypothetical protein FWD66_05025 [Paludibacter sp.]|nr:hypothetical protein [Paludibacter sp.]